ncbi:MAG: tyrosine--tRNA ligase [Malacoplasma sp.]|nr:tyrosine--tRNA ligase [Malacoplasma sp.]MDE7075434.1 tyrosine--tRNA ligase [Malacoplasma sp.]
MKKKNIFEFLKKRGYIYQCSNFENVEKELQKGISFYIGFDPTADSLHVGHFLTMMAIKHLQDAGNNPILVVGGGTGSVGDPSGRSEIRKLLDRKTIDHNCECLKKQMSKFVRFEGKNKAIMLNNADWLLKINWIDFLREFGVYFSVNKMLTADAFKTRFEQESGLSFLEFNYMIMQAYDFYYLNQNYKVVLQMGGSDQWSNILAGADLIRRKANSEAYALTLNLLTKHDGTKMGKSASGTVWLDANKTSPYEFYQYWLNIDDLDVEKLLMLLTEVDESVIADLCKEKGKKIVEAKKVLAAEVTKMIHGEKELAKAIEQSKAAFENVGQNLPTIELNKSDLEKDNSIANILVLTKLSPSKAESRRLISGNGVSVNDTKITDVNSKISDLKIDQNNFVIHKGKKNHLRVLVK